MALLHDMVIAPRPLPASFLGKRPLLSADDVVTVLGFPTPKKWRPTTPDDGGHLVLPRLGADIGGEAKFLDAGGVVQSDDVAATNAEAGFHAPTRMPPAGVLDGGGEETLDSGATASKEAPTPHLGRWILPDLELELGSAYVPKKGEHPLGEDAHFLCKARNAFGIADGVGGWTQRGVDAGEFARQFMCFCKTELEDGPRTTSTSSRLQGVLERALARTTARGTSTALIAAVDGWLLRAVNVGDSAFLVLRGYQVVYHSPPHQRRFNQPYQVGGVDRRDPPQCARWLEVPIQPGDLIVAGTDGLFDNLFDEEVRDEVACARGDGRGAPTEIAREVAWAAVNAYKGKKVTPFTVAGRKAGFHCSLGKPDDVTVVLARVR